MGRPESTGILDRFGLTTDPSNQESDQFEEEAPYRAFGISRKAWGGEPMIVFILKTGQREALPYSDLRRLSFNPSEGITLTYIECIITITGRRLDQGFQKLASQRVVFIAEADHATGKLVEDGDPVITGLVIAEKQVMPRFSSQFEDK